MRLRSPLQLRRHRGDSHARSNVPRQINNSRAHVRLFFRHVRKCAHVNRDEQKRHPEALQHSPIHRVPVIQLQIPARHHEQRNRAHDTSERNQKFRVYFRHQKPHRRHHQQDHRAARRQRQPRHFRRIPQQLLQHLRNQHRARIQYEPQEKHRRRRDREIPVLQHPQIHHRMVLPQLPENRRDQSHQHQHRENLDESARQPVLALPLVQNNLHAAKPQADQSDSDIIHAEPFAHFRLLHVRWIADQHRRQEQRNYSHRDVDVENPSPRKIVRNPAAQPWPNRRRHNHRDPVHRERHPPLFQRKRVVQNRLLARLQTAAARALHNAEQHQHAQARRQSAQERTHREQRHANHVKPLASHQSRKPSGKRQHNRVRHQIRRQHPRRFVRSRRQTSRNVRQRHVRNRCVQHFHERRERHRYGDHPGVDRSVRHSQFGKQSVLHVRFRFRSLLFALILRHNRCFHVHPRPQHRAILLNRIEHDLHRNPLHNLHVISRRVFRRQQTQHCARRPCNRVHMPVQRFSVRIHFYFRFLSRLHLLQLRLFEIRRHPNVLQRHDNQQSLSLLHYLPDFHLLVRHNAVHRRRNRRVFHIQLRRFHRCPRLLHFRNLCCRIRLLHRHLLRIGLRGRHAGMSLLHPSLRRFQLRLCNFHIALRLREFLLVCFQRTCRRIRVRLRRVKLLLRNLSLFHQRPEPRQIRLRQLRIRSALVDICLRERQVRSLRLVVSHFRSHQIRLRSTQLRVSARCSARHVLPRLRNIHSRRLRFALPQRQLRFCLIQRRLIIPRVELHKCLSRLHRLVVIDQNFGNAAVHLRRHRRDVPIHLRVVRALAVEVINKQSRYQYQNRRAAKNQPVAQLRIRLRRCRRFVPTKLLRPRLYPCRVFQSDFDLDAHPGPSLTTFLFSGVLLLLRVNLFHLPDSARVIRSRLIEAVQRDDLIVIRARQRILRLNHFNVVRHARLKAVPRLIHFFFRQLHAQIRHLHFRPRRFQIQQRRLHIQRNRIPQIRFLFSQRSQLQIRFYNLRMNSSARKKRHIHA